MWLKGLFEIGKAAVSKAALAGSKIDPSSMFTQTNLDDLAEIGKLGKEIIKEVLF